MSAPVTDEASRRRRRSCHAGWLEMKSDTRVDSTLPELGPSDGDDCRYVVGCRTPERRSVAGVDGWSLEERRRDIHELEGKKVFEQLNPHGERMLRSFRTHKLIKSSSWRRLVLKVNFPRSQDPVVYEPGLHNWFMDPAFGPTKAPIETSHLNQKILYPHGTPRVSNKVGLEPNKKIPEPNKFSSTVNFSANLFPKHTIHGTRNTP
ncbi:hypothetical protein L2E82_28528 [Cichorium intybus]|uniref:Uncharacterized protein n=1 Tax=Cichorium intybus TaxID=13427 RepID=A0ACB9CW01_CICIN|nr:hypothetical protein L2E82_28528 [Cichorium intybus]